MLGVERLSIQITLLGLYANHPIQSYCQLGCQTLASPRCRLDWLSQLLPCLAWLSTYNVKEWLTVRLVQLLPKA